MARKGAAADVESEGDCDRSRREAPAVVENLARVPVQLAGGLCARGDGNRQDNRAGKPVG